MRLSPPHRRFGPVLAWLLVGAISPLPLWAQPESASSRNLVRLKLDVLTSLPNFVAWPAGAFRDTRTPITICVFDGDPMAGYMDGLEGRAGGRPIVGRRVERVSPSCHVLFVSAASNAQQTAALEAARGLSVLTVSDDMTFPDHGGMVGIAPKGNRIHLAINANAARQVRLTLSSRLLSLASRQEPKVAP